MTTQYTPTLKLALPVTGELSGTWGDIVNDNITSMIEQAIAGLATISTWTGNAHTLTSADGTTSESRCAMLVAADGAGLSAAGEIICPAAAKLYVLKNGSSYAITLKTSAGSGVAVAAGETAFLFCDGTNVNSCVTTIVDGHITGNLTVDGNATINGNTTLGNATSDTITATARFASGLAPSADNTYDLGSSGNSWKDVYIDGTAYLALVDINGGTIDGVSIGASTAATIINVDNLRLDGNTLSSTDSNGNVVIAPNGTGDVQLDADTVRVGDSGAAATLTSNGAGALTVTTGGAANLTLSTNSGTDSGTITIANGANGNITLTPNGTGDVALAADTTILGDANTDTYLTTNGTGNLNLTTNGGTNSGVIQIAQGVNGNITLTPNGTGSVSVPKLVVSTATATRVPYISTGGLIVDSANMTFNGTDLTVSGAVNAGSINATTLDLTNLEVTNIKAKDGTAGMQIADSTGVVSFTANPVLSGGTANGVAYLNGSKVLTTGSALTFDGTNLGLGVAASAVTHGPHLEVGSTRGTVSIGTGYIEDNGTTQIFNGVRPLAFTISGTEAMRLTSTGLGIGTSSPATKLNIVGGDVLIGTDSGSAFNGHAFLRIQGSSNAYIGIKAGTAASAGILFGDTDDSFVGGMQYSNTDNALFFNAGNAERMRLDSSGNLGLGVTPSAWSSGRVLEVGNAGNAVWGNSTANFYLTENAYYNGGWKYASSNGAATYQMLTNSHIWSIAPSGTVGNAISFTQAMTLDASGNLLVGTTSWATGQNAFRVNSFGRVDITRNTTAAADQIYFANPNGVVGSISTSGSTTTYSTSSDYRLKHDIQPMTGALAKVAALKPCTYKWKADGSDGEGFIAHELAEVVPQCVTGEKDAVDAEGKPVYQGIDTSFLVATLTAAIQELMAEVNSLKAEINTLKGN